MGGPREAPSIECRQRPLWGRMESCFCWQNGSYPPCPLLQAVEQTVASVGGPLCLSKSHSNGGHSGMETLATVCFASRSLRVTKQASPSACRPGCYRPSTIQSSYIERLSLPSPLWQRCRLPSAPLPAWSRPEAALSPAYSHIARFPPSSPQRLDCLQQFQGLPKGHLGLCSGRRDA